MRITVFALFLLASAAGYAGEPRPISPGPADPQALTMLHDLKGFFSKLPSLSVTVKVNDVGVTDPNVTVRQAVIQMVFQRPLNFVIKSSNTETGALETLVVCDGKDLYTYRQSSKGWVVMPAPKKIDELWLGIRDVVLEDALPFLVEFWREEPFARWADQIFDGHFRGVDSGNGFPRRSASYTVRNVSRIKMLDVDLVVDDQDGVFPWRLSARNPADVPCYRGSLGKDYAVDMEFSNWNPKPEITEDTFRWNPPAGACEIMRIE